MKVPFRTGRMVIKLSVVVLSALALGGGRSPSESERNLSNVTQLNYGFYGPAGKYLIELFEVGQPYPSRQDWTLYDNKYNGQYTYKSTWTYIVKGKSYFIRVTDKTAGRAKQARSFFIAANWGEYFNYGTFNWYNE